MYETKVMTFETVFISLFNNQRIRKCVPWKHEKREVRAFRSQVPVFLTKDNPYEPFDTRQLQVILKRVTLSHTV